MRPIIILIQLIDLQKFLRGNYPLPRLFLPRFKFFLLAALCAFFKAARRFAVKTYFLIQLADLPPMLPEYALCLIIKHKKPLLSSTCLLFSKNKSQGLTKGCGLCFNISMAKYDARTERIKRKFGADAFKKWGKKGGSPILIAQREGRVTVHKKRKG